MGYRFVALAVTKQYFGLQKLGDTSMFGRLQLIPLDDVDISKMRLNRDMLPYDPRYQPAVDLAESFRDPDGNLSVKPTGSHYGQVDGEWQSIGQYFIIMVNFPEERIVEFVGRARILLDCDIFYRRTSWWSYIHSFDDDEGENAV